MRLRNRIIKATFYTDPELCRWPRDKRDFYRSLWACAEDSCCMEDDMFGVKLAAWPSPADADLTVEVFEAWRDELIADKKLVSYLVDGRRYLYIPAMAEHEKPRNPQTSDTPLPPWVEWVPNGSDLRKGLYKHSSPLYNDATTPPALPCPVLKTTPSTTRKERASVDAAVKVESEGFDTFWQTYPRRVGKKAAQKAYAKAVKEATPESILAAVKAADFDTRENGRFIPHPSTWLNQGRYMDEVIERKPTAGEIADDRRWK